MKTLKFDWEVENLWGIGKSTTKRIIQRKTEFYFIDKFEEIETRNNPYVVALNDNIFSKEELLNEYYIKFNFPYFGFNWDALLDCLRDLDWIKQKDILIYHEKFPTLNQKGLKIYLEILRDLVGHWKQYEEHNFEVYFNINDYDKIQQIML
jgi:hypothetical protein